MSGLRVAIVGAGIGGLTAGIALHRRGIDVTIYEKARELRELGAGVVIGANGARVYDSLGLLDSIAAIAGKSSTVTMQTWQGQALPGYRPPYPAAETYSLHRAEFQNLLVAAMPPGTVRLGHECVAAVEDERGVRIDFADGSTTHADLLIGADGIHSAIQPLVGAKSAPVSEGIMAYRGLIPAERLDGIYDMGLWSLWVGPGQSFLTYPVSDGALLNLVAFVPTDLDVEESWSAPGDVAALAAAYDGWDRQVRDVIAVMDQTFRWGIYDREPMRGWSTDRITLLGDSAHAVTPHLGQGANQSVEDAITLAVLLENACAADIPAQLRRYEELRVERNRQVREGAREAGQLYRSTGLSPEQQADRIVAIYDRLELRTYDAERVARQTLAARA
ncbi:FAD-dependent monooxygenase [Nocardia sp. CA2R105]|uniref:FAD-dependent monooxygenase n=1 Tax=Nocardia coffeae TaxID=2873381 RepID=UPI001CA6CC9B|nr:FAD-dependent monooxygenase [Nocardia coffeae]MBY8857542.1 FAD-dependent monooxygenase [Nocardia coffeae]